MSSVLLSGISFRTPIASRPDGEFRSCCDAHTFREGLLVGKQKSIICWAAVQPFMRPTLDARGDKTVKLFGDTLKDVLEEIAKE